jgi:excisionase family DNA binding protein
VTAAQAHRPPVARRVAPVSVLAAEYAVDLGAAGVLLTSPQAVLDVLTALDGAVRAQRGTGVPVRPEVLDLRDSLARRVAAHRAELAECRTRQAAVPQDADPAPWSPAPQPMTVADAAAVLGVRERQVRYLIASGDLTGRKVGGSWQIDAASVLAAADDRREHHL